MNTRIMIGSTVIGESLQSRQCLLLWILLERPLQLGAAVGGDVGGAPQQRVRRRSLRLVRWRGLYILNILLTSYMQEHSSMNTSFLSLSTHLVVYLFSDEPTPHDILFTLLTFIPLTGSLGSQMRSTSTSWIDQPELRILTRIFLRLEIHSCGSDPYESHS